MKVYLHSDNAERTPRYPVHVCPAGDLDFHRPEQFKKKAEDKAAFPSAWLTGAGDPKQIEVVFVYGVAEVPDELGKYMVARGIAHKSAMLRRVRQFFTRDGNPIPELFDSNGNRIFYDEEGTAFA